MPSDRDASIGPAIYLVAIVGIAYLIVIFVQLPGASRRGDFSIYYACSVAMHRGLDPYAINLTEYTRQLGLEPDPFEHPNDTPTFTLATAPLARFTPGTAYAIWSAASLLCLAASLYLLFGPASQLHRGTAILFCLAALGFTPLADNFRWAQSQTFVLAGVLLWVRLVRRRCDIAGGVLLAGLGLLRGFPLVLGGYLVARRQWRAIGVLAIAFAIGAAATVAMIGIAPVLNFLRAIGMIGGRRWLSLDPQWEIAAANLAVDGFVMRPLMLIFGADLSPGLLMLKRGIVLSFQLLILAITFRATAQTEDDRRGGGPWLWIVTMLILTPVIWLHYLVLLIIPFGTIAVAAAHRQVSARVRRFAMLSYCAVVLVTPLMSTLTFRKDIFDWRSGAPAELGFLALLSAWVAAYRFAMEPFSEASDKGARPPARPGS
jgi:hypothetical protein